MINLAIFASGSGTNAENLIRYFQNTSEFRVVGVFCNNPDAGVLQRAKNLNTDSMIFNKADFNGSKVLKQLKNLKVDGIILAGFLWKIPLSIIESFPDRIINIHPALLPKYGGKGMYGGFVHEEVIKKGETESGITIHLVNQEYDKGRTLFQAKCPVHASDTPSSLAERIHKLEYEHFPAVVSDYLRQTLLKV